MQLKAGVIVINAVDIDRIVFIALAMLQKGRLLSACPCLIFAPSYITRHDDTDSLDKANGSRVSTYTHIKGGISRTLNSCCSTTSHSSIVIFVRNE